MTLTVDISPETMQARRKVGGSVQSTKRKINCQPGILYSSKHSFENEGEMNTLSNKQKLRDLLLAHASYKKKNAKERSSG